MPSYKPVFKEKAIRTGGWLHKRLTVDGVVLTFRAIHRLKSDAQEAGKFYKSLNSRFRIVKMKDGYWVFAGR